MACIHGDRPGGGGCKQGDQPCITPDAAVRGKERVGMRPVGARREVDCRWASGASVIGGGAGQSMRLAHGGRMAGTGEGATRAMAVGDRSTRARRNGEAVEQHGLASTCARGAWSRPVSLSRGRRGPTAGGRRRSSVWSTPASARVCGRRRNYWEYCPFLAGSGQGCRQPGWRRAHCSGAPMACQRVLKGRSGKTALPDSRRRRNVYRCMDRDKHRAGRACRQKTEGRLAAALGCAASGGLLSRRASPSCGRSR